MSRSTMLVVLIALSSACSSLPPPEGDAGSDGGLLDATGDAGAGEPCEADEDCDDGVACTGDRCGSAGTCVHAPDHRSCADDSFCDGVELCDATRGCVEGGRETCNDSDLCTIDRCDEAGAVCEHAPRDLDEDGDVDVVCAGGGDCDDRDPAISSLASEECGNGVDDDCDGSVDEPGCSPGPTAR